MQTRIELQKKDFISEMNKVNPKELEWKSRVAEIYTLLHSCTGPEYSHDPSEENLTPRQYACSKNAVNRMISTNPEEAWWEIYDFAEDSPNEYFTFVEKWVMCLLLETFTQSFAK